MSEITQLKVRIDQCLARQDRMLLAIDGCCGAGKTTLARALEKEYGCNVFHMDQFFLRPCQRSQERLKQPGGNVDYERFYEEVLRPLTLGTAVCYRPYDCHSRSLKDPATVQPKALTVVEGTYSCHPFFGQPYDLRVFLDIAPDLQRQRILQRPQSLQHRFFTEWIPMERMYFDAFSIREGCDLLF